MKDRLQLCVNYICAHECKLGRDAEYWGYCQHCAKYKPNFHRQPPKQKNIKVQKQKDKEKSYKEG